MKNINQKSIVGGGSKTRHIMESVPEFHRGGCVEPDGTWPRLLYPESAGGSLAKYVGQPSPEIC